MLQVLKAAVLKKSWNELSDLDDSGFRFSSSLGQSRFTRELTLFAWSWCFYSYVRRLISFTCGTIQNLFPDRTPASWTELNLSSR